jgi:hypothetical protein
MQAELRSEGCLAGALEAEQQDDQRRLRRAGQRRLFAAEHVNQLFLDDLDNLLRAGERGQHLRAGGAFTYRVNELADDAEIYIRLQQCNAHLT